MSSQIGFQDIAPADNLLVVEDNGKSLSCRVSQVYGRALLGAMALRLNKLRSKEIHVSFLSQDESLTSNEIRKAAQVAAPRDNIMFIDDSRKILSCRINAEYGAVLIEKLQRTPDEASQTRGVALPHVTVAPASDYDNDIDMLLESPQRTSPELHGPLGDSLGILSDQILSSANRQPYDRDWMTKYNINEDCLNGPPGRHKIDVLLRYGAIKAGDKLCITYHPDGAPALRYGEILKCPKSGRLDIRIAPARADFDGVLHDCKGPKDVIRRMDKAFQLKQPLNVSEAWKIVSVVSEHGRDVGSLWKVRQAYQVFTDEMAEWGSRNRQNSP